MTSNELFSALAEKDIICWGEGKHFRNITYPFLCRSGLVENLRGFVDGPGAKKVCIGGKSFPKYNKSALAGMNHEKTVLLITVTGYLEILAQIKDSPYISDIISIPSIYLEALYEDQMMLDAPKPPVHYRKHSKQMIPKIIHTFWFSDQEEISLPPRYRACLESWKKYAPDYEIKIWTLQSYMAKECLFFRQAVEEKMWAFATDYARADVLRRYGGVYMDLDVEMLRPIDDLLTNDAYMSFESLDRIECGSGMGAVKGNRILEEICESYEERPFIKEDGSMDLSTCPVRFTKVIEKHGLVKNGGFQEVEDITIYPFEVLTGKSFDTGIVYRTELSYTLHHHKGSWVPGTAKDAMERRYREIDGFLQSLRKAGDISSLIVL